jgi:hypothetical protein
MNVAMYTLYMMQQCIQTMIVVILSLYICILCAMFAWLDATSDARQRTARLALRCICCILYLYTMCICMKNILCSNVYLYTKLSDFHGRGIGRLKIFNRSPDPKYTITLFETTARGIFQVPFRRSWCHTLSDEGFRAERRRWFKQNIRVVR